MVLPKKRSRGKPALKEHLEIAKEFHYSIQKVLEEGKGGKELLPALDYLAKITRIPITELAKKKAMENSIGELGAIKILNIIEEEIVKAGVSHSDVGLIRAKLEEKTRNIPKIKKSFGVKRFKVKWGY